MIKQRETGYYVRYVRALLWFLRSSTTSRRLRFGFRGSKHSYNSAVVNLMGSGKTKKRARLELFGFQKLEKAQNSSIKSGYSVKT